MECTEKQSTHSILPLPHTALICHHTARIRMVIQLAHNQSENPMAQTAISKPSQTLHVESVQTLYMQFQKLQVNKLTPVAVNGS